MSDLLLTDVTLRDGRRADVRVADGRITEVGPRLLRLRHEPTIEGGGGALLPGLHDHHLHLLATAAALDSVPCGPPQVTGVVGLDRALAAADAAAPPGAWLRGVGYHETVAGDLDRHRLDALVADRPVRIQHRSGALWTVNSAGLAALRADAGPRPDGVERDADGVPTGRLWRADAWLRDRLGPTPPPDLARVGRQLARRGVTGITDATPDLDDATLTLLTDAVADGRVPCHLQLLGTRGRPVPQHTTSPWRCSGGPEKLILADHALPGLPTLVARLHEARHCDGSSRHPVAVHCVTRDALVLLVTAFEEVGAVAGDRIEHASIVPDELVATLHDLEVTVVTQPGLLAVRGDDYLREVHPDDVPLLYRHASLLAADIPVALSSDAPYATLDPFETLHAAVRRTTPGGAVLGRDEAVGPHVALDGLLTPLADPGGPPRRVAPGAPADLCLLAGPWQDAVRDPADVAVRCTVSGGRVVWRDDSRTP